MATEPLHLGTYQQVMDYARLRMSSLDPGKPDEALEQLLYGLVASLAGVHLKLDLLLAKQD